jgi:type III pantothenate kinase
MAILLVDAGNTRMKWARLTGAQPGKSRAAAHAGWSAADYLRRLTGPGRGIERVVISSVAGAQVDRALAAAARRLGVRAEFVVVPRHGGGVRVGYLEPWRLGVDRYVAMVGAHDLFPRVPLWVVGVGTALTLDLVSAGGRHRGGLIVPGPSLMVETLLTRTSGIRVRSAGGHGGPAGFLARSTREAIQQGARLAAAALVDRAVTEAGSRSGRAALVVITGGGSGAVRPLLRSAAACVPDLVLKGLAVLARQPPGSRGPGL